MAVPGVWVQVCLLLWVMCGLTVASLGFLNLEELTEMKYGIEILSEPVIRGQSKADNIVTIASKYKQNYECKLPAIAVKFQQEKEEDTQAYSGLGISDLLKPMEAAPCLTKTKDWWTYEFCYGKHLQQYHIEESEVKGDILYLGYYQSEFDWNNETAKASKHHKLKRYHSQMYVNGSRCDLNGKSRETEVRFMCEEGSGDYIARVDEPQSCTYVLTIHTTRICNHPFLRPPSTGTPQSIRCHPALSPEQYVEYVKAQVSDTKRIVEELSEELKTLDLNTLPKKGSASSDQEKPLNVAEMAEGHPQEEGDSAVEDSAAAEIDEGGAKLEQEEAEIWNRISQPQDAETQMSDTEPTEGVFPNQNHPTEGEQGTHKSLRYRIIRNQEDLMKFIEDLKKPEKAQEELETEGLKGEFDRRQATKSLATTLNKLIDKLDNAAEDKGEETEPGESNEVMTQGNKEPAAKAPTDDRSDGRVKVRVTKIRRGSSEHTERRLKEMSSENPQMKLIENVVKDLLEKEGLKAQGKIEIKILTGGFGEDDDGHWLSEEDTKNLKEIFFNLLIHGTEDAHKEQKRQQQLEDNYRFVWNQNQDDTKSNSASTDSDDVDF
ncbi:protein OS-9 isoform X3 [Lithobates pipiens]